MTRRSAVSSSVGALLLGLASSSAWAQEHPNVARAGGAGGTDAFGIDTVAAFNGALSLRIPLGQSYPVSSALSYGFVLTYSSQAWEVEDFQLPGGNTVPRGVPSRQDNAGLGWRLSFGRYNPPRAFTDFDNNRRTFVAPDGSAHSFYSTLHEGETPQAGFEYSRDGSYLRLSAWSADHSALLEFPNGLKQVFDRTYPRTLEDRFGNSMTISYCASTSNCNTTADPETRNLWRIKDSHNRTHWMTFHPTGLAHQPRVLRSLDLETWNGARAVYDFTYNQATKGGAEGLAQNLTGCGGSQSLQVWLLTQIDLPDGSRYSMPLPSYGNSSPPCTRGILQQIETPTLGKLAWQYALYRFPDASTTRVPWRVTAGVSRRAMIAASGAELGAWVYTTSLPVDAMNQPTGELVNTVTDPAGTKETRYFSVCSGLDCTPAQSVEYGLPFSRLQPGSSGRILSTAVSDVGNTVMRRSYVLYERDPNLPPQQNFADYQRLNQRLLSSSTTFVDDDNKVATVSHSNFDGLGQYRKTELSGTIGAGDSKTTFVDFNPGRGTFPGAFTMIPTNQPWLLRLHGRQSVTEGGSSFHRQHCFDATTGFLLGARTLTATSAVADSVQVGPLGGKDLLWRATPSSSGHVQREDLFGGDDITVNLPTGSGQHCSAGSVAPSYSLRHTYSAGVLATSRYLDANGSDLPFLTVDRTIDPSTGLVTTSADVSGLPTRSEYDTMGRIVLSEPQSTAPSLEDGWTRYVYTPASGASEATAARVEVQYRDVNDGTPALARQIQRFDSFGRPWLDEQVMLDGTVSQRETLYDGSGRRASVSTLGNRTKKTAFTYDPLGRPLEITAPDGFVTRFEYSGIRLIRKTVQIGTAWNGSAVTTQGITTRQFYDRQGRLSAIEEHAVQADPAAWVKTSYSYDGMDRLTFVNMADGTQTRSFAYDGRGFLTAENHPEKLVPSGSSADIEHRRRDALGNVLRTVDGEHDLGFEYDRAGRLVRVYDWSTSTTLEEREYATSNNGNDFRRGKLRRAVRHNRFTLCAQSHNAAIEETYFYEGRMGRASQRDTKLFFDGVGGEAFTQTFSWTPLGRPASVGYPECTMCTAASPRTVSFNYANGWLREVPTFAPDITYHGNGMVATIRHGNNRESVVERDTDWMSRPRRIYARPVGGGPGTEIWDSGVYQYDGTGSVTRTGNGYFTYDTVSRLKEARVHLAANGGGASVSSTVTYDSFGNILAFGGTSGRSTPTDSATNRLCGPSCSGTASYATCGTLSGWNGQSYQHDAFGMLSRTTTGAEDWLHFYTAGNERVWSYRVGGAPNNRWTLRDLDGSLLREYASDNAGWRVVQDYIYRGSELLAGVTVAGTKHFHVDHLGTPRAITGAGGTLTAYHAYYPFGEEATTATQDAERKKLTGHERDLNALAGPNPQGDDLDYMHARFYSPLTGRFLSTDPVMQMRRAMRGPQLWNRYSYALGNPLKYTDPTGRVVVLPADEEARRKALAALKNTVPVSLRMFIRTTVDGQGRVIVDPQFARMGASASGGSGNFGALHTLAGSSKEFTIDVSAREVATADGVVSLGADSPDKGIFLEAGGQSTSQTMSFVYIGGDLTQLETSKTLAHEMRHAALFAMGQEFRHEMGLFELSPTEYTVYDPNGPVNRATASAEREAAANFDPFYPQN